VGDPDVTLKVNWPVTLLFKSPLSAKVPLSVSPETKHWLDEEKLKLEMLSDPSLFTVRVVAKLRFSPFGVSARTGVQVPLIFPFCGLFEPHPYRVNPTTRTIATANFFMGNPYFWFSKWALR